MGTVEMKTFTVYRFDKVRDKKVQVGSLLTNRNLAALSKESSR
jgi:hypothetical protein